MAVQTAGAIQRFGRFLAVVERVAGFISMALNIIGTFLILAIMVLINADVIGRGVLNMPISGVPEIVSLSIVAIVFLQISQAARMGRLPRTEVLLNSLQHRSPRLRDLLEMLFNLGAAFIIWVLLATSYPLFIKAWSRNTYIGAIGDFTAPVWPVKLIILVGCGCLILQFVLVALRNLMLFLQATSAHPRS